MFKASSNVWYLHAAGLLIWIAELKRSLLLSDSKWNMTDCAPALCPTIATYVEGRRFIHSAMFHRLFMKTKTKLLEKNFCFKARFTANTLDLSPPNFSMFSWIQRRPSCWSCKPWLPLTSSPFSLNAINPNTPTKVQYRQGEHSWNLKFSDLNWCMNPAPPRLRQEVNFCRAYYIIISCPFHFLLSISRTYQVGN